MSTRNSSPTARRRQLGLTLCSMRTNAGLHQQVAAKRAGWDVRKIIRIENGESGVTVPDLEFLLNLYKVEDPKLRAWLHEVAKQSRERGWWVRYRPPGHVGVYVGFETAATEIELWTTLVIPGLLQTPAYARSIIKSNDATATDVEIDRLIELRLKRQERLTSGDLRLWAIIDEGVLLRPYPGRLHMREQMMHLIRAMELPNVNIQVCPLSPAPPVIKSPFTLLTLDEGDVIVHAENLVGDTIADDDPAVKDALNAIKLLRTAALREDDSRERIRQVAMALGGSNGPRNDLAQEHEKQPGVVRGGPRNQRSGSGAGF